MSCPPAPLAPLSLPTDAPSGGGQIRRRSRAIYLKQFTELPNAGDVASSVIVSYLTGAEIRVIGRAPFGRPNLVAIGSILDWADANSVVWGAGLISQEAGLTTRPKAVLAVRGHLTRARLAQLGVPCPAVFGDPGVFISDLFPACGQTFSLGVAPHYVDAAEPFVQRAREFGAEILDVCSPLEQYAARISSCRKIITSSLHGLVFAHAYGIPAAWVKISSRVVGNGFKFFDYYSSIGVPPNDIPVFAPGDPISVIEDYCDVPRISIDKDLLRDALLRSLQVISA